MSLMLYIEQIFPKGQIVDHSLLLSGALNHVNKIRILNVTVHYTSLFSSKETGELDILWEYCDTFRMENAKVRVYEHSNEV